MQTQDDIVKEILKSLKPSGALGSDASPSWEQALRQLGRFIQAVDWSQPWLVALFAFHITSFFTLILSRNNHNVISGLLFFYIFLAILSQPLNSFLSGNWQSFASADYFDESGLFLATVYSLPLIINSIIALILVLRATCTMLVHVKRAQLQKQAKAAKNSKKTN
ncbi:Transmembrane protein 18 [Umbelopsis sp. WA50703]